MTERDYALNFYARKLEDANSAVTLPIIGAAVKQLKETKVEGKLKTGWALPEKRTRKAFGKDVVSFLVDRFNQGAKNKKPMNPAVVEKMMRTEKNKDGSKRFQADQLLDFRQIAGFFSREADKRRHLSQATVTTAVPVSKKKSRRAVHRKSHHRKLRHRRHEEKAPPLEDYIEPEDDHPDAGWIRFLKMEEFWTLTDEFYNSTVTSSDIFESIAYLR